MGWLLRLLGISDEVAGNFGRCRAALGSRRTGRDRAGAVGPHGMVHRAAAAANLPHVAPRARQALSACRIGVLLLLVMVLGAPYLHTDETLDLKPVVALIVDDSASMGLPAGPFDPAEAARLEQSRGAGRRARATKDAPDEAGPTWPDASG